MLSRRLRHEFVEVVRPGVQHHPSALDRRLEALRVRDVDGLSLDPSAGKMREALRALVERQEVVVSRGAQQVHDRIADLAGSDERDTGLRLRFEHGSHGWSVQ